MTQQEFDAIADEFGVEHPFEVGEKHGLSRDELLELMRVHNEGILADWAFEFAKRTGRPIPEVRAEVLRQRQLVAAHCNEVYRKEVGITTSKEDTMTKKANTTAQTTAQTTTESKEDTMTNAKTTTKKRLTRDEWKAQYIAGLEAKADELAKKHEGEELPTPVSLFHKLNAERTGEEPKDLYASDLEKRVLALTCLENGWTAEYMTANQAKEYSGEPAEGAEGVKLHGKNVARGYTYYNVAQIVWDYDEPVFAEDVANEHAETYAQRAAIRKANNAQRRANKLAKDAGMKAAKRPGAKKKATKKATTKKAEPKTASLDMNELLQAAIDRLVAEKLEEAIAKALAS